MTEQLPTFEAHAAELLELGEAILELDERWRLVRVNRAQEALFRRSRVETLGRVFWEVWPQVDGIASTCRPLLTRCMEQRVAVQFEVHITDPLVWVEVMAHPLSGGGIAVLMRNIRDAKAAEQALTDTRQLFEAERTRLQAIIDTIPTGLVMLDESGGTVIENDEWKRTWARHSLLAEVADHAAYKGFWPDTGARLGVEEWPCAVSLKQGIRTRDVVLDIERFNGTRGTIVVSSAPLHDAQGRVVGAVAANMDISDLRELQARLQEADRRKDAFLEMLSHELRNPLAPIRTSLYLLDRVEPTGQRAKHARDVISRQVSHLTRLVDDLLDMTRIASGKVALQRSNVDVVSLARRAVEDYRDLAGERGLNIVLAAPHKAIAVDGDETRLAQILANLLTNSLKFTPAGGEVKVELQVRGDSVLLQVKDTGVGIAPDLLPTIFDPFTQAQQSAARTEGGLGLGLALVKGLAELHGGTIEAKSTAGQGAAFTITLPIARTAQTTSDAGVDLPKGGTPFRVLIVDDNVDAADSLSQLVSLLGHRVEVAYDGLSAVDAAVKGGYDLVLCDIGLPDIDGYEVAARIKRQLPASTKLVAVSGYARPEDLKKAQAAGFDAHIAKPAGLERIESLFNSGGLVH